MKQAIIQIKPDSHQVFKTAFQNSLKCRFKIDNVALLNKQHGIN